MIGQPAGITLLAVNSQYVHAAPAPWCLEAGLARHARASYTARVVEGTVNEPPAAVLLRVKDTQPKLLGISCYIWNIAFVGDLLPALREALPGCVIVLGGPEVGFRAADALGRYPQADYVIAGEGELPFARLLDALCGLERLDDVPGLCRRVGDGVIEAPPYRHPEMPPPRMDGYIRALNGRIAYLETSRGCPYACAFCLSGRGETMRQMPLEEAFGAIRALAQSGTRTVKFVDRTFNADRGRALQILSFILREHGQSIPEGVTFHMEIAGDLLDDATLALVASSPKGLFQFEVGLQSMDEETLRLVRRRTDMTRLTEQVEKLIACGRAHVHLDLIAGLPGKTAAQFRRSFDAAYRLGPHALQLGFLKLLYGSAMRLNPAVYPCRFDPEPPYTVLSTPWMDAADLQTLRTVETGLDKLHNSGRFPRTLRYLTNECGVAPFDLFHLAGQAMEAEAFDGIMPLDRLTDLLWALVSAHLPEHSAALRDRMLEDRLSTTRTTILPASLKRPDRRLARLKRRLDVRFPRQENARRAVGILYADHAERAVWCDYRERDPVTGCYPLQEMPLAACLD